VIVGLAREWAVNWWCGVPKLHTGMAWSSAFVHGLLEFTLVHGLLEFTLVHGLLEFTLVHGLLEFTLVHGLLEFA
jgi:hypothetical protein